MGSAYKRLYSIIDKDTVYNTLMDHRHPTPTCGHPTPTCEHPTPTCSLSGLRGRDEGGESGLGLRLLESALLCLTYGPAALTGINISTQNGT